jgi:uncharacterized protein YndB with AHSA1/START domain
MKILKSFSFGLFGIAGIVLLVALFVNGKYAVEKNVTINRPLETVFDFAVHLKNQDKFSTWAGMDPDMKKTFTGTDGTVGFVSAWESEHEQVGRGEQEIMAIEPGKRVDFELRFFEPFVATDQAYFTFNEIDANSTEIAWGFNGKMDYPMNLMLLFMDMEAMLGKDLQTGLDNMKKLLESEPIEVLEPIVDSLSVDSLEVKNL